MDLEELKNKLRVSYFSHEAYIINLGALGPHQNVDDVKDVEIAIHSVPTTFKRVLLEELN